MAEARGVPRRPRVRHARAGGRDAGGAPGALMRVAIVAEYYPRAADPVLGVWAHRQALAARDAGADVRVLVLHRPVPPKAALARRDPRRARRPAAPAAAHRARRDRGPLRAVPRPAAPAQLRALGRVGGAAAARSRCGGCGASSPTTSSTPTTRRPAATRSGARGPARRTSSPSTAATCCRSRARADGERAGRGGRSPARGSCSPTRPRSSSAPARSAPRDTRVVHLGTDLPAGAAPTGDGAALVTVANLVARKRHADVLRALWLLRDSHPALALDRGRRRARAARAGAPGGRARAVGAAALHRAGCRTRRRSRPRAAAPSSCCRASTRRSASPTSRRWPAGVPAIGCARRARAGGDRGGGRRHPARRARRPGGARGGAARAARRPALAARARPRGARARSRPRSRGRAAARRPSPPTRRRCA